MIGNTSNPSPNSSYNKLWALGSKHAAPPPPADSLSGSHSILDSLRKRRGAETAAWLNSLTNTNQTSAAAVLTETESTENQQQHQLIQWLDKLFDQFETYAARFNHTAEGTDLIVTSTRPSTNEQETTNTNEPAAKNPAEKIYEGHLVTRYWSMLLRGTIGTINVYIIPAEILLGFSLHKIDESVYSPLLVIESYWKENELSWHIGGTCICLDRIPLLAKELFGDLIRVASGQMGESELFAHPLQELNLGENLAVGYKIPPCPGDIPPTPSPASAQTSVSSGQTPGQSLSQSVVSSSHLPGQSPSQSVVSPSHLPGQSPSQSVVSPNQAPNQSVVSAQPVIPVGNSSTDAPFAIPSLELSKKMLIAIDTDINQLIQLGTAALAAENNSTFQKVKLLTEKMETLKEILKAASAEIGQIAQSIQQK